MKNYVAAILLGCALIFSVGLNIYLLRNLSEIKGQITVFSSQAVTADEQITDLQEQLADLQARLAQRNEQIGTLENSLEESSTQIESLETALAESNTRIENLETALAESNTTTAGSEEQAAENKYQQSNYPLASTAPAAVLEGGILQNPYSSLSVPTQINKIGEDYFLVDCYHNQILTSTSMDTPLEEWYVVTDQINRGHTIAGDGTVYLADDTENHRILIFEKKERRFYLTQIFENIGVRPHYIVYSETDKRFYALSSMTGELYVFYRRDESSDVFLEKILSVPELNNVYVRSFTIDNNDIYFVACNGTILRTRKKDLTVLERWRVPAEYAGMVQISKIQNYFYITVSTDIAGNADYATIFRIRDLAQLADTPPESLYTHFTQGGTPYYISYFDDSYFLTQHCMIPGTGVWKLQISDDGLDDIQVLYP